MNQISYGKLMMMSKIFFLFKYSMKKKSFLFKTFLNSLKGRYSEIFPKKNYFKQYMLMPKT